MQRLFWVCLVACSACGSSGGSGEQTPAATLSVEETRPADGAEQAPRTGPLWLRFTDEVAPDSIYISSRPRTRPVFKFSEASGREFTYDFSEPLRRETAYAVTVEATSVAGAVLDPPYSFSFTTGIEPRPDSELPAEIGLSPKDGATGIELQPMLSFSFSKAMQRTSVEAALHLEPEVACEQMTWNDDSTSLTCTIAEALPPAATVTVTLEATAATSDGATLDEPFISRFTTRARPRLVTTEPSDGDVVPSLDGTVVLVFAPNTSMDEASLKAAFRYVGPTGHDVARVSCFFERCTVTTDEPFAERQKVSWELSADAADSSGIALGEAATGTFSTGHRGNAVLQADPALDGTVSEAGAVDSKAVTITVGRSAGSVTRSLLSFDLASLPKNFLALSRATLEINRQATSGTPGSLGLLLVYSVAYGSPLTANAFDAPVATYETCNLLAQCTNEAFDAGLSASAGTLWTAPVTDLVNHDLSEKAGRSQMRIEFKGDTTATSDGSHTFTSANAAGNRPQLQIEYWEP
jgi:hypothetical protein